MMQLNPKKLKDGDCVYCFMDAPNGICKIGLSGTPSKRIQSLQNSNPIKLDFRIRYVDEMAETEKYLHRRFHKKRLHGEWFKGIYFDDFELGVDEYLKNKQLQRFNSLLFYQFLYNTDYERELGVPNKVWDKLRIREYTIMVVIGKGFTNVSLLSNKLNHFLSNINPKSKLQIITPNEYTCKIVTKHTRYVCKDFSDWYDTNNVKFLDMCHDALMECYGVVIACNEETYLTTHISEYSKSKGIKVKLINEEKKTKNKLKTSFK